MKIRMFPENNYKAIYLNGKTMRIALKRKKPITELKYPEFYDVKLTNVCSGKCSYCYQNSIESENHFENILEKIDSFFGTMTENQKPFQVALGGGSPDEHPDFISILKRFFDLGITPNYTTNGMNITDKILDATKKYCGGVALSCHNHLKKYWTSSLEKMYNQKIKVNLHIIISDKKSIDDFIDIYNQYKDKVDYFVLLPYISQGRAKQKDIDYQYLLNKLKNIDVKQIAFGANFYDFLKKNKNSFDVSLYEPEILSKYLDMKDMKLYKSSFNLEEVLL